MRESVSPIQFILIMKQKELNPQEFSLLKVVISLVKILPPLQRVQMLLNTHTLFAEGGRQILATETLHTPHRGRGVYAEGGRGGGCDIVLPHVYISSSRFIPSLHPPSPSGTFPPPSATPATPAVAAAEPPCSRGSGAGHV